jgi:transmembrane sensor
MKSRYKDPLSGSGPTPEDEAAEWVLRHDRGLTPAEQDEYLQWLAADPRHGAALAEQRDAWEDFDRLAGVQTSLRAVPDPDLLAVRRRPAPGLGRLCAYAALPLAAALALGFFLLRQADDSAPSAATGRMHPAISTALAAPIEHRVLDDGSSVRLNRGASIAVEFTAAERRVRLVRGEAAFAVAKNPDRPFIVHASGVDVRAVGTEFNVRLVEGKQVEVLVTEGRVQVDQADTSGATVSRVPLLEASQGAVIPLVAAAPPQVDRLGQAQIAERLAWQPRLLDFTAEPLSAIVAEFNRCNPVQLNLGDPALRDVRLSAAFRSDNVEGFVRLMESDFGMVAEWRSETEIVLRRK